MYKKSNLADAYITSGIDRELYVPSFRTIIVYHDGKPTDFIEDITSNMQEQGHDVKVSINTVRHLLEVGRRMKRLERVCQNYEKQPKNKYETEKAATRLGKVKSRFERVGTGLMAIVDNEFKIAKISFFHQ